MQNKLLILSQYNKERIAQELLLQQTLSFDFPKRLGHVVSVKIMLSHDLCTKIEIMRLKSVYCALSVCVCV